MVVFLQNRSLLMVLGGTGRSGGISPLLDVSRGSMECIQINYNLANVDQRLRCTVDCLRRRSSLLHSRRILDTVVLRYMH